MPFLVIRIASSHIDSGKHHGRILVWLHKLGIQSRGGFEQRSKQFKIELAQVVQSECVRESSIILRPTY